MPIFFLLLLTKITEALEYADFGLPSNNACVVSFNQSVYIFDRQSLKVKFDHPWDSKAPQIMQLGSSPSITTIDACSITQSGKVILMPSLQQQQPLQVLDDINVSWKLNNNINYLGSQNAIDIFINKQSTKTTTPYSITTFNDYIIFYNGNQTFSLDTRYDTLWTFYEIQADDSPSPPPPFSTTTFLYATSRWVLNFRYMSNDIYVDCFDPYSFQWLGTILNFKTTTRSIRYTIQAVPVVSSAKIASDSLLILVTATQGATNNDVELSTTSKRDFWKLDISTSNPDNYTLTQLNQSVSTGDNVNGKDGPVLITPLDDSMALFYGGRQQLEFMNMTTLIIAPQPQWLIMGDNNTTRVETNPPPTPQRPLLAIILGSVFGGLFLLTILLIVHCCCRRKSKNKILLRPNSKLDEKESSPLGKKWHLFLSSFGKKPKSPVASETPSIHHRQLEDVSQFSLSPIVPLSPILLFPLPSDSAPSSAPIEENPDSITQIPDQPRPYRSRFEELFYHHSLSHPML